MFRLLRAGCFFINHHHHHFRIGVPTIHFRQSQLNPILFELWLVSPKVFRLLRDGNFNSDTCIAHHPTSVLPSANHHRIPATTILTFDIWDFEFAVFPFPKVFRLLRDESPSSWYLHQEHRYSSSSDGNLHIILVSWYPSIVYSLVIALITPSPFCVTCLSRLAIWVLPATLLVHISDHTSHSIHTISSWCIYCYHILCHKFVPVYTQLLSWFVHFALWHYKK